MDRKSIKQPRMDGGDNVPPLNSVADGYWEKGIHKYKHVGMEMPWHTEDKPFGMTQEEWDAQEQEHTDTATD